MILFILLSFFFSFPKANSLAPSSNQLKVLTYNVGALAPFKKIPNPTSEKRIKTICNRLRNSTYDVIFLQEVWTREARKTLSQCGLSYVVHGEKEAGLVTKFKRGELTYFKLKAIAQAYRLIFPKSYGYDTGLMILSRFPLKDVKVKRFQENGLEKRSFLDGEFPVNKGILSATIEHPRLGKLLLANTHLVSFYPDFSYNQQRKRQLDEVLTFINKQEKFDGIILGGDFNTSPPGEDGRKRGLNSEFLWPRFKDSLLRQFIQAKLPYPKLTTFPYQGNLPDLGVIDHLFSRGNLLPISGAVVFKEPLSDHYGFETTYQTKAIKYVGPDLPSRPKKLL